jgi:hypothetical protein
MRGYNLKQIRLEGVDWVILAKVGSCGRLVAYRFLKRQKIFLGTLTLIGFFSTRNLLNKVNSNIDVYQRLVHCATSSFDSRCHWIFQLT